MNKQSTQVMFSSKSDEWSTPNELFVKLDRHWGFTLDPCASDDNHKCEKYYTIETDGLAQSWEGETAFVNPPYGDIKAWVKKCHDETKDGKAIAVLLIPSRTDTRYFHEYCMKASHIYFVKARLKFSGHTNSAPFPSMIVAFTGQTGIHGPTISTLLRD